MVTKSEIPNIGTGADEAKLDAIADAIYGAWWDGPGHVCANHRCPECLGNAKIAARIFFEQVNPWTLEVNPLSGVNSFEDDGGAEGGEPE